MPKAGASQLVSALVNAFEDSGGSGVLISAENRNPRRFITRTVAGPASVWIYIWTMTHGGRATLPDEYRVQMTGVASPLALNPLGYTVLLGYEPNLKILGGFDLARHTTFTAGSPSVQIDLSCLHNALADGLAFDRKDNDEIVVGIRTDQLLNYVANATVLHREGAAGDAFLLLSKASALEPVSEAELNALP